MAVCTKRNGQAVSCSCPGGYRGDGVGKDGCVDIDECANDNGGCDTEPRATCTNHIGAAPSCECPNGSAGNGVGVDGCQTVNAPSQMVSAASAGGLVACGKFKCDEQTVHDPTTGLTWQRRLPASYDGCTGRYSGQGGQGVDGDACKWDEAKAYCMQLTLASGGWRLPTKDELLSIVDMGRTNPCIDVEAFPDTPSQFFWSSSADAGSSRGAWIVSFSYGYSGSNDADSVARVRCVR